MKSLKFTSCMAENFAPICEAIVTYTSQQLQMPIEWIDAIPWQEREKRLDRGEIQVGWICGLPYVWKADQAIPSIELLAAPVIKGDRYQGKPIYFSDVVVRQDSSYHTFADLRGCTWAYNEPRSHSGYYVTRAHLAALGEFDGFFGAAIESGAHQTSLQWILDGKIDASAIDSTVLELELQRHPEIAAQIRIIDDLGASPIPPWVISTQVPPELRDRLQQVFLHMHQTPEGKAVLSQGTIDRFVAVDDRDYDALRHRAELAETARL
ncbi:MAG: PhnD/SsuA/transferrin family substrate-binding protein [Drouetiella hepatica Uher 2000/2452]|jgi:phosphonate transport system substrate-binding protein|uniref:PhnD/SsuA/transferrin family substrate-binding protein n=1 Tax=Drouetiella hepatica Uher 2000/2452 TaxID=904376 RepID=A0A951QAR9_9CYAN|nr:PhnD/SsuA/transferrin family substrate-binding protein [Drouetiella hepatica Uher 2000/2452]